MLPLVQYGNFFYQMPMTVYCLHNSFQFQGAPYLGYNPFHCCRLVSKISFVVNQSNTDQVYSIFKYLKTAIMSSFSEPSHSLASYCRMFWSVSMYFGNVFCERDTTICMKVKVIVAQSCLTLCDPMDCSLPGSSVHAILQARILECIAMPSSRGFFPTQGSNPGLLHCRRILYHLSH